MTSSSRNVSGLLSVTLRVRISCLLGFVPPNSLNWSEWTHGAFSFAEIPVQNILKAMLFAVGSGFCSFEDFTIIQLADFLIDEACFREHSLGELRFALLLELKWLFPTHLSWGRTNFHLTRALAALDMACACEIMLMDSADTSPTRKKYFGVYSRFLRPKYQEALLTGGYVNRWALQNWKAKCSRFFRHVNDTVVFDDLGINYIAGVSRAHRNFYPGYCRAMRQKGWRHSNSTSNHNLGFPARWYEHKALTIRQQYGHETRYRLWRKHSPWCTHVFIAFFGSRQAAYMREQFIFRSYAVPTVPRKRKPDTPRPHVAGEFCANDHLCTCAPVFTAPSC